MTPRAPSLPPAPRIARARWSDASSSSPPPPSPPTSTSEQDHLRHRDRVRRDEMVRRVTSGALLGVIGANTIAPVVGPLLTGGPGPLESAARGAIEQVKPAGAKSPLAVRLDAARVDRETRAIFADVDARLRQVDQKLARADHALGAPDGTTRAAVIERILVSGGLEPAQAQQLAHDSLRSENLALVLGQTKAVLGQLDVGAADLVVGLARVADQVATDRNVELAFVLGSLAVLPRVSAEMLPPAVAAGQLLVDGYQRHQHAMDRLKNPGTGHAAVDAAGRIVGEAVDLVAHGLAFFGPMPFLKLARGTDVMLILADCLAAKTAVAGTTKTLSTYTNLPTEFAAFMLGALSTASIREGSVAAVAEGNATAAHLTRTATDLHAALQAGDRTALVNALERSAATMTDTEKAAVAHGIRAGVEALASLGA